MIEKGIRKAVASVETINIPSIKSIEKIWDGFLPQKFYDCRGNISHRFKKKEDKMSIRSFRSSDQRDLFEIYKECANRDWRSFLEIDRNNFLDRFIEHICPKGLLGFFVKKEILVAIENNSINGYAVVPIRLFPPRMKTARHVYLFVSEHLSVKSTRTLVQNLLNVLFWKGIRKIRIYSVNRNEPLLSGVAKTLNEYQNFQISENLVSVKTMRDHF